MFNTEFMGCEPAGCTERRDRVSVANRTPLARRRRAGALGAIREAAVSDCWSIYIDIEGFSALWAKEDQVLWSLGELMRAIFRLGRFCFPHEPDRLFAHQFGD